MAGAEVGSTRMRALKSQGSRPKIFFQVPKNTHRNGTPWGRGEKLFVEHAKASGGFRMVATSGSSLAHKQFENSSETFSKSQAVDWSTVVPELCPGVHDDFKCSGEAGAKERKKKESCCCILQCRISLFESFLSPHISLNWPIRGNI